MYVTYISEIFSDRRRKKKVFVEQYLGLFLAELGLFCHFVPGLLAIALGSRLPLFISIAGIGLGTRLGFTRIYRGYTRVYKGLQYTCQRFMRCKREIFILGVLGFLKTARSFPKIPEEVFRRSPKSSEDVRSLRTCINASSLPVLFTSKIRDREEGIVSHLFILHVVFVPYMGLS